MMSFIFKIILLSHSHSLSLLLLLLPPHSKVSSIFIYYNLLKLFLFPICPLHYSFNLFDHHYILLPNNFPHILQHIDLLPLRFFVITQNHHYSYLLHSLLCSHFKILLSSHLLKSISISFCFLPFVFTTLLIIFFSFFPPSRLLHTLWFTFFHFIYFIYYIIF